MPIPGGAEQGDERALARPGALPLCTQPRELVVAPGERRRSGGVELARQLPRGDLDVERGVLAEDRLVQTAQLRARLDADLVHERASRFPVGVERLRLAPAAVQREHALGMQALAQRVLGDDRVDLPGDLQMVPRGQVRVERELDGLDAQLLEAPDLRRGERRVGHVGQRRAAPQRERLARGVGRLAAGPGAVGLGQAAAGIGARRPSRGRRAARSRARA